MGKNMRIILSRKGFDSSYGSHPSIILPDNKMISFPIPVTQPEIGIAAEDILYVELGKTLDELLHELNIKNHYAYHVDPEIQNIKIADKVSFFDRGYGTLGQSGAAASHLANNHISSIEISKNEPAVFIFFGLFSKTKRENGKLKYDGKPFHAIFGYVIADEAVKVSTISDTVHPELKSHLHYINQFEANKKKDEYIKHDRNIIFKGKQFGTFKYSEDLRLTVNDSDRTTRWGTPDFIKSMTYNKKRIDDGVRSNNKIFFDAASRGQEFIITEFETEKMKRWLKNLGVKLNG